MSEKTAFINTFGEESDLEEKDLFVFNPKNSTISFKRRGNYLAFNASPSKDSFRHVYFIRNENDFNELAQLISKLNGFSGKRIKNDDNVLIWEFTEEISQKIQAFYGATIVYNPELRSVEIFSSSDDNVSVKMIIGFLKSEKDFFELANLIACTNKCLSREVEEAPNTKTYSIDLIPL